MARKSNLTRKGEVTGSIEIPAMGWKCRDYQKNVWNYITGGGKLACVAWHRRAGKDLMAINLIAYMSSLRKGTYWHVFPQLNQGRRIIWEGMTKDGKRFLDYLPGELREDVNKHEMRINLTTGSTYQIIGGDNPDKLVGANPVGVVFSEYAIISPDIWTYLQPILAENDGWALFISTPRGHNHYYKLFKAAELDPEWFAERLTIDDTKAVTPARIEKDRKAGMSEAKIRQEYYVEWEAPIEGAYYGEYIKKAIEDERIRDVPYDPTMEVYTAWDLGIRDTTVIIFYQVEPTGNFRIFDLCAINNQGIGYFANVLKAKGYNYAAHNAPWDIVVRELSGNGKSRQEIARQMGINFRACPKMRVEDGIEIVRSMFPLFYFDKTKCDDLIEALKSYKKEWDNEKESFKKPTHDWSSHFADALRVMCVSHRNKRSPETYISSSNEENYRIIGSDNELEPEGIFV